MIFKFPTEDVALGFCDALADPDFDVAACPEISDATMVDVLGLDDHPQYAPAIREIAAACGGTEIVPSENV